MFIKQANIFTYLTINKKYKRKDYFLKIESIFIKLNILNDVLRQNDKNKKIKALTNKLANKLADYLSFLIKKKPFNY